MQRHVKSIHVPYPKFCYVCLRPELLRCIKEHQSAKYSFRAGVTFPAAASSGPPHMAMASPAKCRKSAAGIAVCEKKPVNAWVWPVECSALFTEMVRRYGGFGVCSGFMVAQSVISAL